MCNKVLIVIIMMMRLIASENIILNIGIIADSCSNPIHVTESTVTAPSAWNDNLTVILHWKYIDHRERYRLLQAVYDLGNKSIDSVLLVDNITPFNGFNTMLSKGDIPPMLSVGIVNTSSNELNSGSEKCGTETSSSKILSSKSNCEPPIRNTEGYFRPKSSETLNLLSVNVVSVIQYLQWTSLVLLYERVTEDQVASVISTLSDHGTIVTSHRVDDIDSEDMNNILEHIDQSDLQLTNISIVCLTECTTKVMAAAEKYVESKQRVSSLRHHSRWLIFEVTDGKAHSWLKDSEKIDNLACVTLPLYVLGKGESTKKVDSMIKNALSVVGSNESLADSKKSSINTAILNQLEMDIQKCHWSPVETLMWINEGRAWSSAAYMDINGRLSVNGDIFPNTEFGFNGRRFNVSTLEWDPFVKFHNGKYEGLCFDLLEQLSINMNFTYEVDKPPDGDWGVIKNGTWTGMVGQLAKEEVDIVVAPLSTQAMREEVMDFTYSFFIDYTTILMRKPDPNKTKWRTLIDPFSNELLICIVISLPVMSLLLFLLERFSPYYMSERNAADRSGLHTYQDSFWYMYGALLTQGGEHLPRSQTGRTLLGSWWIFCIILMASYSGNLIAFLTVNKSKLPFNNLLEMVNQKEYTWGTIGGSSWVSAFEGSETTEFKDVWKGIVKFNESDPSVLSQNSNDHFNKVAEGEYAYIGDKAQMEIKMSTECDLVMADDEFMPLQYAFGLPNNSPYAKLFSDEMINIHESGLLHIWKTRRWPRRNICDGELVTVAKIITLIDVQSAFYIIIIGIVVGFLVLFVENIVQKLQKHYVFCKNKSESEHVDSNGNMTFADNI